MKKKREKKQADKKEQTNEKVNMTLKDEGSFETDVPVKVENAKLKEGVINCTIKWAPRKNGQQPKDSFYSNIEVRKHCPDLLLDFYESRINC